MRRLFARLLVLSMVPVIVLAGTDQARAATVTGGQDTTTIVVDRGLGSYVGINLSCNVTAQSYVTGASSHPTWGVRATAVCDAGWRTDSAGSTRALSGQDADGPRRTCQLRRL